MTLKPGDRVRHTQQPGWGLGKVLSIGPEEKVRVRFVSGGEKVFRNAPLETVTGVEADDPRLNEGPARRAKAKARPKAAPAKDAPPATFPDLVARFRRIFPEGFEDSEYVRRERRDKQAAHLLMNQLLGREPLAALVAADDFDEIKRRAMRIVDTTSLLFSLEKVKLHEALSHSTAVSEFAAALAPMLAEEGDVDGGAFEAWAEMLRQIGAVAWTTATYFPFLADPQRHLFVKPKATQMVAAACGFTLDYRSNPNGETYRRVLELAELLRTDLAELGPRDLLDIQSFIGCVTSADYEAESRPAGARRVAKGSADDA